MKQLFDPIKNIIDVNCLKRIRLLGIGCGRVGFAFVSIAVHHGIRQLWLIEDDVINARNFSSGFPESAVGVSKAAYAVVEIKHRRSDVNVRYSQVRLASNNLGVFLEALEWCTHVCFFIDSFEVVSEMVKLAYAVRPSLYAALLDRGRVGEAAWSIPHQTPCLGCTARLSEKQGISGGETLLIDVMSTVNLSFRQFLGLCLISHRGFDVFQSFVNPHYCLAYAINGLGGFVEMPQPDTPCGVRLVEVVDEQGRGPSCPTCVGYRP